MGVIVISGINASAHKGCILLLLGGMWHDFEGFSAAAREIFGAEGYGIESTYNLDALLSLERENYAAIISYTSLSKHEGDYPFSGPEGMTDDQVDALCRWVRRGGALLAAHSATVVGDSKPALAKLLGGAFLSHPEQFAFTVYPLSRTHPIVEGIEAFTVHDELYYSQCEPDLDIHMVALDRGVAHPMVWSREESQGRVVHVALGHNPSVWRAEPYQRLMWQAMRWAKKEEE